MADSGDEDDELRALDAVLGVGDLGPGDAEPPRMRETFAVRRESRVFERRPSFG